MTITEQPVETTRDEIEAGRKLATSIERLLLKARKEPLP